VGEFTPSSSEHAFGFRLLCLRLPRHEIIELLYLWLGLLGLRLLRLLRLLCWLSLSGWLWLPRHEIINRSLLRLPGFEVVGLLLLSARVSHGLAQSPQPSRRAAEPLPSLRCLPRRLISRVSPKHSSRLFRRRRRSALCCRPCSRQCRLSILRCSWSSCWCGGRSRLWRTNSTGRNPLLELLPCHCRAHVSW